MSEDVAEATTQRLAFDKDDADIPQFLKKGRSRAKRVEEEVNPDDLEQEAADPISDNSTEDKEMENLNLGHGSTTRPVPMPAEQAKLQDLAELSIEQLKAQQAELDRRIQEKQKAQRASVIEQIVNVVKEYDVPIEELVEALGGLKLRRKGTKAKAKYRDPATGTTWSGRGKEPAWIKGMVDRSPFEIH
jgi:DNA-binding protein H-NS